MKIHNRLVPNGKFVAVENGLKEFKVRPAPACIESHELDTEFTMEFNFKSLHKWHNISIDKSYLDKSMILVDDMQIFYKQLKIFFNNVVQLSSKNFEGRPLTIQTYDVNSQAIQAIKMCLFHLEFFANSIQVASTTIQNTNNLKMSPEGSDSTQEICKACNQNDTNDRLVHNKTLTLAQIKRLSDKNAPSTSHGSFSFFSNMYRQVKSIGVSQLDKIKMKSSDSSQNLLKVDKKSNTDDDIIRRNVIVKVDVNNNWILLEKVLRYSEVRQIPVVVVFNLKLEHTEENKIKKFLHTKHLPFLYCYANRFEKHNSNIFIFYMALPDLNFHVAKSIRYEPSMNEMNNFLMADIDFNNLKFQLAAINGSKMSDQNEQRIYLRLSRIITIRPSILIVQSPQARFHTKCADGDFALELTNAELLNQLEFTDGTLVYITKEFPEEIRNIRVFTGSMRYRRSEHHTIQLEAGIVVVSMPLNQ